MYDGMTIKSSLEAGIVISLWRPPAPQVIGVTYSSLSRLIGFSDGWNTQLKRNLYLVADITTTCTSALSGKPNLLFNRNA